MKAFKDLTIGSVFYKVYTNYEAKEKPRFETIVVKNITLEDGVMSINTYSNSYRNGAEFQHPLENCNVHVVEKDKVGFFTTDYETLSKLLQATGIKIIKSLESEIEVKKKEIESVRKAYWDYLKNDLPNLNEL